MLGVCTKSTEYSSLQPASHAMATYMPYAITVFNFAEAQVTN